MICNVQMLSSCSSLAHCTPFSALLSAPSFAWQCLTPWLLICLAPGPTLNLCVFSTCDHKGVSIGIDRSIDRYGCIDSIDSSTVSTVIDSYRQYRQCGIIGSLEHSIDSYRQLSTVIDSIDSSTVRQYRQSIDSIRQWFDSIDSIDSQGSVYRTTFVRIDTRTSLGLANSATDAIQK